MLKALRLFPVAWLGALAISGLVWLVVRCRQDEHVLSATLTVAFAVVTAASLASVISGIVCGPCDAPGDE